MWLHTSVYCNNVTWLIVHSSSLHPPPMQETYYLQQHPRAPGRQCAYKRMYLVACSISMHYDTNDYYYIRSATSQYNRNENREMSVYSSTGSTSSAWSADPITMQANDVKQYQSACSQCIRASPAVHAIFMSEDTQQRFYQKPIFVRFQCLFCTGAMLFMACCHFCTGTTLNFKFQLATKFQLLMPFIAHTTVVGFVMTIDVSFRNDKNVRHYSNAPLDIVEPKLLQIFAFGWIGTTIG